MNALADIFSYVGKNLKNFLIIVAIKFGFYMTLLTAAVILLLNIPVLTRVFPIYCVFALLIVGVDMVFNIILMKKRSSSFTDSLRLFLDQSHGRSDREAGNAETRKKRVLPVCRRGFGLTLLKVLLEIIIALPFFLISFFLTAGYKTEMIMFSMIPALIFFLFIRSALINPIISLLAFRRILNQSPPAE